MSNVFEERNFNQDEKNAIKNIINDVIDANNQIKDLQDHITDVVKNLCERLNENVSSDDQKIKPTTLKKLAKIKAKENLQEEKEVVSELETGMHLIFGQN